MSALIEGCWIDSAALPLPYPAVDLLVFADGTLWLAGPEVSVRTGPLPPGGLVGLRLRPGACLSLGVAADEVPLGGMPFGRVEPGSPRLRMASAVKFLDGCPLRDNDFAVQQAVCALQDDPAAPDIAQQCGFYDQPHLIAEFRAATGQAPKALHGRFLQSSPA